MPYLDVSDVLLDPMIADRFTVKRRVQSVSAHGRTSITTTEIPNVVGVVNAASPNDLERLDDSQRMGRHLSIVTKYRLVGPAPGLQPDLIHWGGDDFIVQTIDPYPQYGQGFVQAIVGSINIIDQPTPEAE